MTIPKYYEFMKPILEFLSDNQVYKRIAMYQHFAVKFQLTEAELQEWLPSGKQLLFNNRVGWALTYLKKAKLIDSPARASYRITELGQQVLAEDPQVIDQNFLKKFEDFQDFIDGNSGDTLFDNDLSQLGSDDSPQDILERAIGNPTSVTIF